MFCPECGHDVDDDSKFCPNCGKNLAVAEAQEESADDVTGEETPTPAVPESPEPAVPPAPEPAVPDEDEAMPPSYDSARDDTAEEIAGDAESPASSPQPTPQPESPSETPPTAAPSATPSAAHGPEQQGGQVPPAEPSPPPAGADAGASPPAEKKTNWGSICLIGCIVLLVLGALAGLGIWLAVRWGTEQVERLPQAPANIMDLGEQDREETPDTDPQADETDETVETPGGAEGLGELIGRIGEAVEGAGAAMSAANVRGFDPTSVDALMLPTFYGFMIALAEDNPDGMHQWMSPELKQQWSPDDWSVSPQIEHRAYDLDEQTTLDDGTVVMVIDETMHDRDDDEERVISWEIHFEQIDRGWFVTYLE